MGGVVVIRVVIGDDETLVRVGLRKALEDDPEISVVGEASTGLEALTLAEAERPDVLMIGAGLPRLSSLEVTRRLSVRRSVDGEVLVILIMPDGEAKGTLHALQAGARGVIVGSCSTEELRQAVRIAGSGSVVLTRVASSHLMKALGAVLSRPAPQQVDPGRLTDREREIFSYLGEGLSNREIAKKLGVEVSTVKSHIARLLTKMDLPDRTRAALVARDLDRYAAAFGTTDWARLT
jgi:DNA-binding NarL/FixJ family response regulator